MEMKFGKKRGVALSVDEYMDKLTFSSEEIRHYEYFDLVYRTLCAVMYNYVPTSGHPGGSISSGRFVQRALFETMSYDISNHEENTADILSYAAGHKALGLYALLALRNEAVKQWNPELLPKENRNQVRLEDLLGFRRNPTQGTKLFKEFKSKALDGHPSPSTPFVKLSTGASGVGLAASCGLALGALDFFGSDNAPVIHVVEGEGGMTPGRVAETFACAATSGIRNLVCHIDWNQSSIDSDCVCAENSKAGDYVQWNPVEFAYMHDWNVVFVPDGKDFRQIFTAQKMLKEIKNNQPTAIIYRTVKGWQYGIEGKGSHGAGHKFCSEGFYNAIKPAEDATGLLFPRFCGDNSEDVIEQNYYECLLVIRKMLEKNKESIGFLATKIKESKNRLVSLDRKMRASAPDVEVIFDTSKFDVNKIPEELKFKAGDTATLRGALGDVLHYYNKESNGAILSSSADLLGSTSVTNIYKGISEGFYHSQERPNARALSIGGICEDAMGGVISGVSSFGKHIGVGSSYAAFLVALHHITMRLHGIGQEARVATFGGKPFPFISICAHAGLATGEDGPTHADSQALQLVQGNFPKGVMVTLTPWDPQEIWPLMTATFHARPCVIASFVTRPNVTVPDREKLKLAPASAAAKGVYALRTPDKSKKRDGTLVLQESGITYTFIEKVLPKLDAAGLNLAIYYVASVELFEMLTHEEQENIFPDELRREAMGITGFTLPTMYQFITSEKGRNATLYPFKKGHYLGSGQAEKVIEEAGLGPDDQYQAIISFMNKFM
jgi:transketolase